MGANQITSRRCDGCTLCCTLLPVKELDKLANQKCRFEKTSHGCSAYGSAQMPLACRLWNCRWLVNDDTADLPRPDAAHYVIDVMPDFVTATSDGVSQNIEAVQVWVDPAFRDAHRCEKLRAYLDRRGREGKVAVIRYNSKEAFVLVPPSLSGGSWLEIAGQSVPERSPGEIVEALSKL